MAGDNSPIKTMIPGFGRTGFGGDETYPNDINWFINYKPHEYYSYKYHKP